MNEPSELDDALATMDAAALEDAYLALGWWYMERYETLAALDEALATPDPDAESIGALCLDAEYLRREGQGLRLTCLRLRHAGDEEANADA